MKDFLEKYIDEQREAMLDDLSKFISIASVSDDKEKVAEALSFILDLGKKMGFEAKECADGQVGVIEMGEGEEALGILAHVDVVPPGDRDDWDSDPFKAELRDGRVYGRGTLDDKGMIIASLYAMKAAREMKLPMKKRVQLILGTQEEVSWTDMDAYVKDYPLPDYGFSPDGEYPICNIEKGTCDATMSFDVSDDPSSLEDGAVYVSSLRCGTAKNAVPGKAIALLSDGRSVTAVGKGVHSCQPERGENAIFILCDKLKELGVAENRLMRLIEAVTEDFSDIYGSSLGLYNESEYYQGEFVHRNAFSPTVFNAENGKAELNINNRFPYGTSEEELHTKLAAFAEKNGGAITEFEAMPAVFVSKERPFLKVLAEAYESVSGLKNEFTLAYGGSYAKAMPNVVSWGPIFPGEEDTCHENNEYIGIESMLQSAKIFALSIAGIVFEEKSLK